MSYLEDEMAFWRSRGKTPSGVERKRRKALESLESIAAKNDVDASELINSIVEAWEKDESRCEQLSIRCREKTEDSAIFLFMNESKVVAQFPIPLSIIQRPQQLETFGTGKTFP